MSTLAHKMHFTVRFWYSKCEMAYRTGSNAFPFNVDKLDILGIINFDRRHRLFSNLGTFLLICRLDWEITFSQFHFWWELGIRKCLRVMDLQYRWISDGWKTAENEKKKNRSASVPSASTRCPPCLECSKAFSMSYHTDEYCSCCCKKKWLKALGTVPACQICRVKGKKR